MPGLLPRGAGRCVRRKDGIATCQSRARSFGYAKACGSRASGPMLSFRPMLMAPAQFSSWLTGIVSSVADLIADLSGTCRPECIHGPSGTFGPRMRSSRQRTRQASSLVFSPKPTEIFCHEPSPTNAACACASETRAPGTCAEKVSRFPALPAHPPVEGSGTHGTRSAADSRFPAVARADDIHQARRGAGAPTFESRRAPVRYTVPGNERADRTIRAATGGLRKTTRFGGRGSCHALCGTREVGGGDRDRNSQSQHSFLLLWVRKIPDPTAGRHHRTRFNSLRASLQLVDAARRLRLGEGGVPGGATATAKRVLNPIVPDFAAAQSGLRSPTVEPAP